MNTTASPKNDCMLADKPVDEKNTHTPPASPLAPLLADPESHLASRGDRLKAALVDAVIGTAWILPIFWYFWSELQQPVVALQQLLIINVYGFIAMILMNGYLWNKYGQSIGKRVVGIKIVDMNGNKPPLWEIAILRHWFMSLGGFLGPTGRFIPIIDALFIFGKSRRCIHDYIAGTQVVRAE